MGTCKSCKWWVKVDGWLNDDICCPVDPDTFMPMEMPWEVRYCTCPRIRFYERPIEPNEAAVVDGSGFKANLLTASEFGCVLHEYRNEHEEMCDRELEVDA